MQIQEKNCNTNFLRITIFHDNFQMHHTTSSSKFIQSKFHILFSKSKEFISKQSIWPLKLCQNIIIPFSNWPKLKSEFYFKKNFEKECLDQQHCTWLGMGQCNIWSNLPGLKRAGSIRSGLEVAAITKMPSERPSTPSN